MQNGFLFIESCCKQAFAQTKRAILYGSAVIHGVLSHIQSAIRNWLPWTRLPYYQNAQISKVSAKWKAMQRNGGVIHYNRGQFSWQDLMNTITHFVLPWAQPNACKPMRTNRTRVTRNCKSTAEIFGSTSSGASITNVASMRVRWCRAPATKHSPTTSKKDLSRLSVSVSAPIWFVGSHVVAFVKCASNFAENLWATTFCSVSLHSISWCCVRNGLRPP